MILALATALPACGYPSYAFDGDAQSFDAIDDAPEETIEPADVGSDADAARDAFDSALPSDAKGDTGTPDVDADAGDAKPPCPILSGGDACKGIPRFTAPKQVLDGIGDEFCDVPATRLVATAAPYMLPTPPPSGIDTVVLIRTAWSPTALHVHVHVDQGRVSAPGGLEEIWRGDGVEVFASGFTPLTGKYDGTSDPGALQIIAVPPGASASRAELYSGETLKSFLPPSTFAARLVPGGYEVELEIDWTSLHGTPKTGLVIGFDLGVDVRQDPAVIGPKLQSFLAYTAVSLTPCSKPTAHPSCDDRTWCTPTLL